jgi:hypothetical protein
MSYIVPKTDQYEICGEKLWSLKSFKDNEGRITERRDLRVDVSKLLRSEHEFIMTFIWNKNGDNKGINSRLKAMKKKELQEQVSKLVSFE